MEPLLSSKFCTEKRNDKEKLQYSPGLWGSKGSRVNRNVKMYLLCSSEVEHHQVTEVGVTNAGEFSKASCGGDIWGIS